MQRIWSVLLSFSLLLTIVGCSQEQFAGQPSSESNSYTPPQTLQNSACGDSFTLIKPKVDILYVVDNSASTYYLGSDIKNSISNTINSISSQFDFRVVGIPLMGSDNSNYQVYSNSTDLAGLPSDNRKLTNVADFTFFSQSPSGTGKERGLGRIHDFMNAQANGLFRKGAYHLVILISNGNDQEVELAYENVQPQIYCVGNTNPQFSCPVGQSEYEARLQKFNTLKGASKLDSQQFRIFSVTAPSACQEGWRPSEQSYRKMSRALYDSSLATDAPSGKDTFNLCNGQVSSIFTSVNSAIQQIKISHKYKFWPISFANNSKPMLEIVNSYSDIEVYKFDNASDTSGTLITNWQYYENTAYPNALNTTVAELPTGTEESTPVSARHFIKFDSLNDVVHPNCVLVKAKEKTEYFEWIVVNQKPDLTKSIVVRINGIDIPQSATNGWSYSTSGQPMSRNTKADYPNPGDSNPPVLKSGFMFKLNGVNNYYKSGDQVNIYYTPAAI